MIISGYQGIGKSTLAGAKGKYKCIDLESSNFWVNGERPENWYKIYCQIALSLSTQDYVVFVSSHKEVRDELKAIEKYYSPICVIYPSINLKDKWIEKLEKRYEETKSDKDYKALSYAKDHYKESIAEIMQGGLPYYEINSIDYRLVEIIEYLTEYYKPWGREVINKIKLDLITKEDNK